MRMRSFRRCHAGLWAVAVAGLVLGCTGCQQSNEEYFRQTAPRDIEPEGPMDYMAAGQGQRAAAGGGGGPGGPAPKKADEAPVTESPAPADAAAPAESPSAENPPAAPDHSGSEAAPSPSEEGATSSVPAAPPGV